MAERSHATMILPPAAAHRDAATRPWLTASAAVLLGLLLLFGAGFAQSQSFHDAAHDVRHSMGFPCH